MCVWRVTSFIYYFVIHIFIFVNAIGVRGWRYFIWFFIYDTYIHRFAWDMQILRPPDDRRSFPNFPFHARDSPTDMLQGMFVYIILYGHKWVCLWYLLLFALSFAERRTCERCFPLFSSISFPFAWQQLARAFSCFNVIFIISKRLFFPLACIVRVSFYLFMRARPGTKLSCTGVSLRLYFVKSQEVDHF